MAKVDENGSGSTVDSIIAKKSISPIEVQLGVIVRRLIGVDTVAQTFGTQLTIIMMWDCPEDEQPDENDDGDWVPAWTPKYRIRRVVEEIHKEEQFSIQTIGDKRIVKMEAEFMVNIQTQLSLNSFPVDCQELPIEIMSVLPTESFNFTPLRNAGHENMLVRLLSDGCQMVDFDLLPERPFTFKLCKLKMLLKTVSQLTVKIHVQRKANYYMINVALVMLLICSFAFCAWACHPADLESRHGVDFNLILTAVAFKLVLTSMLPPVSYLTVLDMYVGACFMFLAALTICHSLLPCFYYDLAENSPLTLPPMSNDHEERLLEVDKLSFHVSLAAWCVFNVFGYAYYRWLFVHERARMLGKAKHEQAAYFPDDELDVIDMTSGNVVHCHALAVNKSKKSTHDLGNTCEKREKNATESELEV